MDKGIRAIAAILGIAFGGLCWLTTPASAAPVGAAAGSVSAAGGNAVQQVRWFRRCWRDRWGYRHCRRVWRPGYYYGAPYYYGRRYWGGPRRYYRGYRFRGDTFRPRHFRGYGYRGPAFRGHMGRRR